MFNAVPPLPRGGSGPGYLPSPLHRLLLAVICFSLLNACDDFQYPRDPKGTLNRVLDTQQMTVAVVEHPPWVILSGEGTPRGAEVELLEAFARDLGAAIEWRRLPHFEALKGLEWGDLDLAVGSFEEEAVLPISGVGPTYAYFEEEILVAHRPGVTAPQRLEGQRVFVPANQAVSALVRQQRGTPTQELTDAISLAALPRWQLESRGFLPGPITLRRARHVMAVPEGENAWLLRLERFLRLQSDRLPDRLGRYQE